MPDLVLRARQVLLDGELRPASVAVTGGVITEIGAVDTAVEAPNRVELPAHAVLLPGFVDTHVHVNEPGTDWEGFGTATAAAAVAGITTIVDMPLDCRPVTTTVAALRTKQAVAEGNCRVDVKFWAGVVPENLGELESLAAAGVRGFKCFLSDSGNPDFGYLTPAQFRIAMSRIAELGSVLLVHAESHRVIAESTPPHGRRYSSFLRSRPDAAEEDAVRLVIETAAASGAHAHIVHVSSANVLPMLADAKRAGIPVTAETCPHYLTFTANEIPDGGTEFAACPPVRDAANRERLWDGLLDGTLDMVVSDHSPCSPNLKADGDFGQAFGGVSSLQVGPSAVWAHAAHRGFGLPELSRWMAQRPAALAGLADRGSIAPGLRADLCAFDPDAETSVLARDLLHRHRISPYSGLTVRGAALQTWVAGVPVLEKVAEPV
ncbi:allantoinase AllB [Mycolicibacterium boenickei]|uniref:allantoinase n=1 Tax=Mycolicibacterium boenickei TaxID=146017 RepID=A0AAX2ZRM5_9MYCO|nr:allantoinase AllB [Mycolicibacterium boenickei]PEG60703.1 allantoinase AllB [Mycolicibacterium boenickei]UNB97836.1 allantoinase AllB [Mycolicibacterium boenickei]BBX93576.1 allantoinase [Mycolicibacterium boenickei]